MPLSWNDDNAWILRTEQPLHGCAMPYVGNGRLGLRLGALILGTDLTAPPLVSAKPEKCRTGTARGDHSFPLQSFAAHARDGFQYCLPSWANIDLGVGARRFQPEGMTTSSTRPLTSWLDLRTGEAGLDGVWRCDRDRIDVSIRLLIPRGFPHGAFWELELSGLKEPAALIFGLKGAHLTGELSQSYRMENGNILGTAHTLQRKRELGFGLRWKLEGEASVRTSFPDGEAQVHVKATGSHLKLQVFHSVRGGTELWNENEVSADLVALEQGVQDGSLRTENSRLWRALWSTAPDLTVLPLDERDRRFLLAQQFYLLASYDGSNHPTGPLGLSGNAWQGQLLWDTDLWHFRALNAFWPELARQSVRARLALLPGARRHAKALGLQGAWYGWISDEEGNEMAPPEYQNEIHNNAWIALAAWDSSQHGRDLSWLKEVFPILSSIADAVCSRAERDPDGSWHLRRVLPPDESVVENPNNPGVCDDSVSTNLAFRAALRAAITAAQLLDQSAPDLWSEVADKLVVLAPGPDNIIPEYHGYSGHDIKQADLILAFWPLNGDFSDDVVRTNLDYYRDRVTWGPLMTEQIDACIRLRRGFGDRKQVLHDLLARYRRYVRGAFEVPYECVDNTNSLMLTACGGIIQALAYGWFHVVVLDDLKKIPRLVCA